MQELPIKSIRMKFSCIYKVNGVPPSSQPLGHILSEDIELNEISDELSQVIMQS